MKFAVLCAMLMQAEAIQINNHNIITDAFDGMADGLYSSLL